VSHLLVVRGLSIIKEKVIEMNK